MDTNMSTTNNLISALEQKFKLESVEKPTTLLDWLYSMGKASEALLYSILFMPELLIVESSVLLAWSASQKSEKERFLELLADGSKDIQTLEASFNFIEVGYLFDDAGRDMSDEEDELLANLICNAWSGWLKASFPEREFQVEVLSEEDTGSTVGVHFFEVR